MNEEEKEATKYLEFLSNEKCECEACQRAKKEYKTILNLLDNQQKEIEKLMKICDFYKNASDNCAEIFLDTIKPNYISKNKIREKIEKIKTKTIGASTGIYAIQIDILEELLEEN